MNAAKIAVDETPNLDDHEDLFYAMWDVANDRAESRGVPVAVVLTGLIYHFATEVMNDGVSPAQLCEVIEYARVQSEEEWEKLARFEAWQGVQE